MELEKRGFGVYMAASTHHVRSKEKENHIFGHNCIFSHTWMHKLTILSKQWNYNIFVQIFYSYFRYTDRLLDVFFLSLAVIFQSFMGNQKEKIELQKKIHRRSCVREIPFLPAYPRSFLIFCRFFCLLFSPMQATYLLNGPFDNNFVNV